MFGVERKIKIAEIVNSGNSVRVCDMAEKFNVSPSTIRRDLMDLQHSGLLQRTHGGAIRSGTGSEPSFNEQERSHIKEKESLGEKAAALIQDGDTVFLDSGTTITYIPRYITAKNVTVLTNSVPLIWELTKYENLETIIIGGSIRAKTKVMVGPVAERTIRQFRVDKLFLGANGVSLHSGITTPDLVEASAKKAMLDIADKKYVVADSSKFGVDTFSVVCSLSDIDCILTDDALDREEADFYIRRGVDIIRC